MSVLKLNTNNNLLLLKPNHRCVIYLNLSYNFIYKMKDEPFFKNVKSWFFEKIISVKTEKNTA